MCGNIYEYVYICVRDARARIRVCLNVFSAIKLYFGLIQMNINIHRYNMQKVSIYYAYKMRAIFVTTVI